MHRSSACSYILWRNQLERSARPGRAAKGRSWALSTSTEREDTERGDGKRLETVNHRPTLSPGSGEELVPRR